VVNESDPSIVWHGTDGRGSARRRHDTFVAAIRLNGTEMSLLAPYLDEFPLKALIAENATNSSREKQP